MTNLDREIRALRPEPPPAGYDQIDQAVWRGVAEVRGAREAAPAPYAVRASPVFI